MGVPTVLVSGKLAAARVTGVTGATARRRLSRAHALPPTGRAASAPTVRGTDVPS